MERFGSARTLRAKMDAVKKQSRRYEFCRQVWGGLHDYMAEQIQCVGSRVNHEVRNKLNLSCELARDEVGTQLNYLQDVQGELAGWGGGSNCLAKAVDSKLTKIPERSDRR